MGKKPLSPQAKVAKIIRTMLKKAGIAGKVRGYSASMMTGVEIKLDNAHPSVHAQVYKMVEPYQSANYSVYDDMHHFKDNVDHERVKIISVETIYSDELRQAAWEWCKGYYGNFDSYERECIPKSHTDIRLAEFTNLLNRALSDYDAPFWDVLKKAV